MKFLGKILLILLLLALSLAFGAIWLNRVPITAEPGWAKRLLVYLTRNEAVTGDKHEFPELRPREYAVPAAELFAAVRASVVTLGWQIKSFDPAERQLHAVVSTSLLDFKDDLRLQVDAANSDTRSRLSARSGSRVGRADFGANLGHILELQRALGQRLGG
jgi:uncharacterized protein (DUF1499 family)